MRKIVKHFGPGVWMVAVPPVTPQNRLEHYPLAGTPVFNVRGVWAVTDGVGGVSNVGV